MANEDLLDSTGNSTQGSMVTCKAKKAKEEGVNVYIQLIHFTGQQKQNI